MTRLVVDAGERTDTWEHLAAGDAPGGRDFTVEFVRWLAERRDLLTHAERTGCSLGVRLAIDSDPGALVEDVESLSLIVIEIPDSSDGRFFSIAARVREHLRYGGELRVTGDVAPDQLAFMQRCGINAFELVDDVDMERFIRRYERFYQSSGPMTTGDNLIRLARRRHVSARDTVSFAKRKSAIGAGTGQARAGDAGSPRSPCRDAGCGALADRPAPTSQPCEP